MRSSSTVRRSSSRRAISACANGSYAKSASGGAAPEPERLVQQPRGARLVTFRARPAAFPGQALEAVEVELVSAELEHVAGRRAS